LALACASTLLGLLLLEAGLSLWRPLEPSRFQADERLLFRLKPGFRTTRASFRGGTRGAPFEVNSLGFRGPELLARRSTQRVVVYGDSFVEAYATPWPQTFAVRLGARLSQRWGREVEIINAGVGGYGPDQVSLRLDSELESLEPDWVVVVLFAGNDFGDLVRNKIFRFDATGRLVQGHYRLSPEVEAALDPRGIRRLALRRALRLVHRRFRPLLAGRPADEPAAGSMAWVVRECEREWRDYRSGSDGVSNPLADHYDLDFNLQPDSEAALTQRRLMAAILRRMRERTASRGVPLLALLVPAPDDLRSGPRADELRSQLRYRAEVLTDALAEAAQAADVRFVNLFEAFRRRGGDALYDAEDLHWNAEGQELAANLVAQALPQELPRE
jgi:lysophospholipase L1-like esterase